MKIKSIVLGAILLSAASYFGMSAEMLVPPAITELDNKYFNGAVMKGMNRVGQTGRDNIEKGLVHFSSELKGQVDRLGDSL
ncbi:TPA: hypothetical protein ACGSTL_001442 [Vibrio parahaemolyticus]|uniref:hypothetical protein n=1 Tax=Vibrio campbellii TaxID=680 RepID=UPI001F0868DD|nr:hypothetical protein [Vibrio campbellii]UMM06573.1 hypothetical protein MKR81_26870 [Vibrio campbellii]